MTTEQFIVLLAGKNSEVAFGPFNETGEIENNLTQLGFKRINSIWWQKGKSDAYIKRLNLPGKMMELT